MTERNSTLRQRICARCGGPSLPRHRCRRYRPAKAAAVADLLLPADASLDDVSAVLAGTPADVAYAAAHLPQRRLDAIWQRLADDRDQAHREAA